MAKQDICDAIETLTGGNVLLNKDDFTEVKLTEILEAAEAAVEGLEAEDAVEAATNAALLIVNGVESEVESAPEPDPEEPDPEAELELQPEVAYTPPPPPPPPVACYIASHNGQPKAAGTLVVGSAKITMNPKTSGQLSRAQFEQLKDQYGLVEAE